MKYLTSVDESMEQSMNGEVASGWYDFASVQYAVFNIPQRCVVVDLENLVEALPVDHGGAYIHFPACRFGGERESRRLYTSHMKKE